MSKAKSPLSKRISKAIKAISDENSWPVDAKINYELTVTVPREEIYDIEQMLTKIIESIVGSDVLSLYNIHLYKDKLTVPLISKKTDKSSKKDIREALKMTEPQKYGFSLSYNGQVGHIFTSFKSLTRWVLKDVKGKRHARGLDMFAELSPLVQNEREFIDRCGLLFLYMINKVECD